jgi:hypothetical protein
MKSLLDTVLFATWVSVYLAGISWVSRFRRARVHALGPSGRSDYRADKDIVLWLTVFVLGVLLFLLAYVATQAIGHIV